MAILGFIKGELIEIIEFKDDSLDTLSWRFPDDDHAIKNGAQPIEGRRPHRHPARHLSAVLDI